MKLCPRCIGGRLYTDMESGLTCILCGHTPEIMRPLHADPGPANPAESLRSAWVRTIVERRAEVIEACTRPPAADPST